MLFHPPHNIMKRTPILISEEEQAALAILRSLRGKTLAAAILAREALRIGRGSEKRAHKCLKLGEQALLSAERTITFAQAVELALEMRRECRKRTIYDFRYLSKRLITRCPGLATRRLRSITPCECAAYLKQAFDTPRQRSKAHAILSGIFHTAQQHGWCSANPMRQVEKPRLKESEIRILTRREIQRLMHAAENYRQGICLPAVALMLYAGLRPHEVTRLSWQDINLTHRCISIQPRHSKTGGARRVTIHRPLLRILRRSISSGRICPPCWAQHWVQLHRAAGFTRWQPDVLRHTFASHHLAHFRNYAVLQLEMGHRSAELLRTRYVSMPQEKRLIFS